MSDDVWGDESAPKSSENKVTVSGNNPLSVHDLLRIQADRSADHMEIQLCYTGMKAYVKPLRVNDKKELLKAIENKNEALVNRLLDTIIEKYVQIPEFTGDKKNLVQQERYQILAYIRVANGDKVARIGHQCPECEHVEKDIEYDLDDLYVKNCELNKDDLTYVWDVSNEELSADLHIRIGALTRVEEKRIEEYIKREKIETDSEKQLIYIAGSVKEVFLQERGSDNVQTADFGGLAGVVNWYKSVPSAVDNEIKKLIEKLDFGVKMPFDFKCSKCGYQSQEDANVAVFFIS